MILNENTLRRIIKSTLTKNMLTRILKEGGGAPPDSINVFADESSSSFEQENSMGVGKAAGTSSEIHITPKDGKMVFVNPLIGCYLKQQTLLRHKAIIKILASLKDQDGVNTVQPNILDMSDSKMGNEYRAARDLEIKNTLAISPDAFKKIINNFEKIGYFDKNGYDLMKSLIENNFYSDVWNQMYAEIRNLSDSQGESLSLSNVLSFYCMFSYINQSTFNPGRDASMAASADSANSFGSFSSKIEYYKTSKTVALLTKIVDKSNVVNNLFVGENENNPTFQDILKQLSPDSSASEENKVLALQVYFYDRLMKYLGANAEGKNINFSLMNELIEFMQKLVMGFYNLIIICSDIDQQISAESDKLKKVYVELTNSQRSLSITSEILNKVFSALDIVIIEGISKYIQKDFYKVEIKKEEKIKIKEANKKFTMGIYSNKTKQSGGKGVQIPKCPVPAACCTQSTIQFNINLGGNQNNTQYVK